MRRRSRVHDRLASRPDRLLTGRTPIPSQGHWRAPRGRAAAVRKGAQLTASNGAAVNLLRIESRRAFARCARGARPRCGSFSMYPVPVVAAGRSRLAWRQAKRRQLRGALSVTTSRGPGALQVLSGYVDVGHVETVECRCNERPLRPSRYVRCGEATAAAATTTVLSVDVSTTSVALSASHGPYACMPVASCQIRGCALTQLMRLQDLYFFALVKPMRADKETAEGPGRRRCPGRVSCAV